MVLFHLGLIIADAKYFDVPWVATPFRWGDAGVECVVGGRGVWAVLGPGSAGAVIAV